jgi:hypothetical protein
MPFLSAKQALSGVAGGKVAAFPQVPPGGAHAAQLCPKFHSIPRNLHGKVGLAWRAAKCLH